MKIEDFGEKIGGAKKDLWKDRGLIFDDVLGMNDKEKIVYIKKDNIWKKPNYKELVSNGMPIRIAYFMKKVRDSIPPKAPIIGDEAYKYYIEFIQDMRDSLIALTDDTEIKNFYMMQVLDKYVTPTFGRYVEVVPEYKGIVNNRFLKAVTSVNLSRMDREIEKKQFCFSEEEKILSSYVIKQYQEDAVSFQKDSNDRVIMKVKEGYGSYWFYPTGVFAQPENWKQDTYFLLKNREFIAYNFEDLESAKQYALSIEKAPDKHKQTRKIRKKKFIPPQLEHIIREGENYRKGRNITGIDYIKKFQFRAGEFGNWMNQNDRQTSLNYGYDALLDLGKALSIDPKDLSLDKELAIAFGARGSGNAMAHYEPLAVVINLTKIKGAGSLAHEWGHALDDYIGKKLGISSSNSFASNHYLSESFEDILPSMCQLMDSIKFKTDVDGNVIKTDFYKNSILFDKNVTKTDHGYWQSNVELFARAFACYIYDKVGYRSDYLCGHANNVSMTIENKKGSLEIIKAIPEGEERRQINNNFDELILELKEKELLHNYDYSKENIDETIKIKCDDTTELCEDENGELCLFNWEDEIEK